MSSENFQQESFDALLQRMCDERLTEADKVELVRQLHDSATARRRYMEFVQLTISLADWSLSVFPAPQPTTIDGEPALRSYLHIDAASAEAPPLDALAGGATRTMNLRKSKKAIGMLLAASILVAVAIGALTGAFDRHDAQVPIQVVDVQDRAEGREAVGQHMYVARVVEVTSDAEWDVDAMPREFLMRLRPGEKLHLERGLAKVEFYSGARLILHGPARFEPTGQAAGYLHEGRISGRVDNAEFLLVTPTAEVIDLGTEFGVSVGSSTDTDVLVFDGEVNVRSDTADPRVANESVNLTEGMTVRIGEDGRMAGVSLMAIDEFSRSFAELASPTDDGLELSLVDILCGGSGRGRRLAAAIDPLTGDWDRLGWQKSESPGTRRGDVDFHTSSWHPMIDGSFIPNANDGLLQVDSRGSQVSLPSGHGMYTWGPVWARRFSKDLTMPPKRDDIDFWGADTFPVITKRLADSRYGGIGIHASVGITFDLQGVRDQHAAEIDSFQAVLTNLDNAEDHNPEYARSNVRSAHFFVVIDGEVRYQQLDFRRNVDGIAIEVPISPGDRMLTLITTDAGNSNKYDHIVLIDPVLNLHSEIQALRWHDAESLLSKISP